MDKKENSAPPKFTPGWNDPPPLASKHTNSKRIQYKRVPFPISSPECVQKLPTHTDATLEEVMHTLNLAITNVDVNSSLVRDLESMRKYWNDANCPPEVRGLVFQTSKHISKRQLDRAEELVADLASSQSSGWFTLFLRSVINLMKGDK